MDECTVLVSSFERERIDLDGGGFDTLLVVPERLSKRDEIALRRAFAPQRSELAPSYTIRPPLIVIVRGVGVRP